MRDCFTTSLHHQLKIHHKYCYVRSIFSQQISYLHMANQQKRAWPPMATFVFVWVYSLGFQIIGLYCLYLIFTLQYVKVAIVFLLIGVQKLIGKKERWYVNLVNKYFKPTRFFKRFQTIYEGQVPDKNTLFAYCPHAVYCNSFLINLNMDEKPLSKVVGLGSRFILNCPVFGLLLRWWGMEGVHSYNMNRLMKQGQNIALVPGGYQQATITTPKAMRFYIKNRKGFIKFALKYGYNVVPVLVLKEHQMYHTVDSFKNIGLLLNKIKMPGVIHYSRFGLLPDPNSEIITIVGNPIALPHVQKPSHTQIDVWHKKFIEDLVALYEKHKHLNDNLPLEVF